MNLFKFIVPLACISINLPAQSTNDLNGLVSVAAHYVSSGMAGTRQPVALALHKVVGDNGALASQFLMSRASDVQHWTFMYRINAAETSATGPDCLPDKPGPKVSAQAQCTNGVFNSFLLSDKPVVGVKSLENTWVAIPLDGAIQNLNANGYVQGFSSVELVRPDRPNLPDDMAYVFTCPWERRVVAISSQTGALAWSYGY